MNTKNKSTENSCKSCVWKWFFGENLAALLLGLGTCVMAGIGIYTTYKAPDIFNEITKLQNSNNEIKQATYEIMQAVNFLMKEQGNKHLDSVLKSFTQQTQNIPDVNIQANILKKNIENELGAATKSSRPWGMYISNEKINDLTQKFKQNPSDLKSLKNEFLQSIETSSSSPRQESK